MLKQLLIPALLLMGAMSSARAQYFSEEDMALRNQALKQAAEGKKEAAFASVYAISNLNLKSTTVVDAMRGLAAKGHLKSMLQFAALRYDTLAALKSETNYRTIYESFCMGYAALLIDNKSFEKAYTILKPIVGTSPFPPAMQALYAEAITGSGRKEEAVAHITNMIIAGRATPYVTDTLFKKAYVALKGSVKGFDVFKDSTVSAWQTHVRAAVKSEMIDKVSPSWALKDDAGNTVSLASLKGKTVVLDFWATWCAPCKASFPTMKTVQDRYKNNPDVVFLFIHCFNREENPVPEAMSYLQSNNYDFKVLFDLRDTTTKQSAVATSYGIKGIPTKIVIDREGNIRFQSIGGNKYTETDAMAAEHLAAMIELARAS